MNTEGYRKADTVAFYGKSAELMPCERVLFDKWIQNGAEILDLGVGGGRTTPHLAQKARRYLGIDVIPEMVERCRSNHPELEFKQGDAANLSELAESSFDVVVFSFNGVDHLDGEARKACFRELFRVLRPSGVLIFSTHCSRYCLVYPRLHDASFPKMVWRLLRAPFASLKALRRLFQGSFWRGYGVFWEEVHGGMPIYAELPARTRDVLASLGFRHLSTLPSTYPGQPCVCFVPFYYHVFTK